MKSRPHYQRTLFIATLLATYLCSNRFDEGMCNAQSSGSLKRKETASMKLAKTEVKLLMESTKYQEIQKMIKRWGATKPELKKQIVLNLLGRLNSKQKLTLDKNDTVTVVEPEMDKKDIWKENHIRQDVFMEAGRSAWALEYLFQIGVPQFYRTMTDKRIAQGSRITMLAVVQMMVLPDYMNLEHATVEEKIRIAQSQNTPITILDILAGDIDPKVRLAIAQHPMLITLRASPNLERDKNLKVRQAAIKNMNEGSNDISETENYYMQFAFPLRKN